MYRPHAFTKHTLLIVSVDGAFKAGNRRREDLVVIFSLKSAGFLPTDSREGLSSPRFLLVSGFEQSMSSS